MKLYELCGADRDVCFSPYVWRVKYFLAHKGVSYETVPLHFVEKSEIDGAGAYSFPTIGEGGKLIKDSFNILQYLDDKYPEKKIFATETELAQASALLAVIDKTILPSIFSFVALDVWEQLDEASQVYFRSTREAVIGQTLESFVAKREERLEAFLPKLDFLRAPLVDFPFLSGKTPGWLDYTLMGTFMWVHTISDFQILPEDDALFAWHERMRDLWDGKFRNVPRAVVQ